MPTDAEASAAPADTQTEAAAAEGEPASEPIIVPVLEAEAAASDNTVE